MYSHSWHGKLLVASLILKNQSIYETYIKNKDVLTPADHCSMAVGDDLYHVYARGRAKQWCLQGTADELAGSAKQKHANAHTTCHPRLGMTQRPASCAYSIAIMHFGDRQV